MYITSVITGHFIHVLLSIASTIMEVQRTLGLREYWLHVGLHKFSKNLGGI